MWESMKVNSTSRCTINGKSYSGNVSIVNGKVINNGKEVDDVSNQQQVHVTIEGDCGDVSVGAGSVEVSGDIKGSASSGQGDVSCEGDIHGYAKSGQGDIRCSGSIQGDAKTGMGDIKATSFGGKAKSGMGKVNIEPSRSERSQRRAGISAPEMPEMPEMPDFPDIGDIFGGIENRGPPKTKPPKQNTGDYNGPQVDLG